MHFFHFSLQTINSLLTLAHEMKAVVLFYLSLILLCCGVTLRDSKPHHHHRRHHVKINNSSQFESCLTETEENIDEYHADGEDERGIYSVVDKNTLANTWYVAFTSASISTLNNPHIDTLPQFCGYSTPIYIAQRVLRI